MDPLLMAGAWAAAVMSVVAAANVMYRAFLRAVKSAVTDEFRKVWRELDDQDRWQQARFQELAREIKMIGEKVDRLEGLLGERV
jgi:TolA-binding protein